MYSLTNLFLLYLSLPNLVSSSPSLAGHIEGQDDNDKNMPENMPATSTVPAIGHIPHHRPGHFNVAKNIPSSTIGRRSQAVPPPILELRLWPQVIRRPPWDGKNCFFWADMTPDEQQIEETGSHLPDGSVGWWLEKVFTMEAAQIRVPGPVHTHVILPARDMADEWGRPAFVNTHRAYAWMEDKDGTLLGLMMQAMAEVSIRAAVRCNWLY